MGEIYADIQDIVLVDVKEDFCPNVDNWQKQSDSSVV